MAKTIIPEKDYKLVSDELKRLGVDQDLCAECTGMEIHNSRTVFEVLSTAPLIQLHLARRLQKLISKK